MKIRNNEKTYVFENPEEAASLLRQAFLYLDMHCCSDDTPLINVCHMEDGTTYLNVSSDDGTIKRTWKWYDPDKVVSFRALGGITSGEEAEEYLRELYERFGIDEEGAIFTREKWLNHIQQLRNGDAE